MARASRIYVEGKHDAELVEKIWGDDLRDVGVVVEYLEGIDDLPAIVRSFSPAPGRRLGVLVDHLVAGSKETRIAGSGGHGRTDRGTPVRRRLGGRPAGRGRHRGLARGAARPAVEGRRLRAIGWPPEVPSAWQRILRSVTSYADLEPELLGRVEELIDFVTTPGSA